MKTELMVITPEIAKDMLSRNISNRPLRKLHVDYLVREIESGRWKVNGDSVRFCHDGTLIDGQHRLHAVLKSGVPVKTLVAYGVDKEAFATIDNGMLRTSADSLALVGQKNCTRLAAALALIDDYKCGRAGSWVKHGAAEAVALLQKYPNVAHSLLVRLNKPVMPLRVIDASFYLFNEVDSALAHQFVECAIEGKNIDESSPWWSLRRRALQNQSATAKLPAMHLFAFSIKAWNGARLGKSAVILKWGEGEPFPKII